MNLGSVILKVANNEPLSPQEREFLRLQFNKAQTMSEHVSTWLPNGTTPHFNYLEVDQLVTLLSASDISLGGNDLTNVQSVQFDTTPASTPTGAGAIYWDAANHTFAMTLENGVTLQVGQEVHLYAKNTSGGTLANGTAVSVTSAGGSFTVISKTDATNAISATSFVGLVTEDAGILDNAFGYVTTFGVVRNVNTAGMTEGLPVYVDPSTPGALTQTPPTKPNYFINVGIVEYAHANHGRINVIRDVVPKIGNLSDVSITTPASGDALTYDSATQTWKNGVVITVGTRATIMESTPTSGKMAYATDYEHFYVADGTSWFQIVPNGAVAVANLDMGYYPDNAPTGYGDSYITDKDLANIAIGSSVRTANGGLRVNLASDPDTLEVYLRGAWYTIIYDLTTANGDFRHTPLSYPIYVWRGDSVQLSLSQRPMIQEYSASMGAYSPPRTLNGGTF